MPKHSRKRDLELSMPACVPPTKSAKSSDTAGKAGSPRAGKAKSPHKSAKSSDTAAKQGAHVQLQAKQRVHIQQQANQRAHVNRPNQVTHLQGLTFQQVRHHLVLKMQFLEN